MFQTAQGVVEAALRFAGQFDALHLPCKRLQDDLALQSGQKLPHTHVDAGTEAHMTQDLALDVVLVRLLPLTRIAGGRTEQQQDLAALLQTDAAKFSRSSGRAKASLPRRLVASGLLNCRLRQPQRICPP